MSRSKAAEILGGVSEAVAPAVMLLVLALIFRRLIAGRVLAGGDLHIYFYPYWTAVARTVHDLRIPLWNSYLFAGAPLAANSQVGLFYPLNWPFWVFASPALSSVARALHLSVLLHLGIASVSVYVLGRASKMGPWAAALAGIIYAGCGFLGTHVEHLNQLQALAWLPLLFLPARQSRFALAGRAVLLPGLLPIVAFAMILLAGHTQMAFIAATGVVVWYGTRQLTSGPRLPAGSSWRRRLTHAVLPWIVGLMPFILAGVVAAAQLLPTLQLTGLSGRSVGLDWRESVSFSVRPWDLLNTLAPPYLVPPALPEGVAYTGSVAALFILLGLWKAIRTVVRRQGGVDLAWVVVAGLGLFMALGAYNPLYLAAVRLHVPGFIHFRAPARFLALYVLGVSLLAGAGMEGALEWLRARWRSLLACVLPVIGVAAVGLDLLIAAEYLPHAQATVARAYSDLRPATAHLVAAAQGAASAGMAPERFLSVSQMLFEVGDKAEIELVYGDSLSSDALWAYMVASKQREILTPNLPLAFGVPAADGYDGGLLPMRYYIAFSELLIPGGTLDGRLRENLSTVPDTRWLDLLGVRYVLTDKTGDTWVDDILYDREFRPAMAAHESLTVAWMPPDFEANAIGLLYDGGGLSVSFELADGRRFSEALPASSNGSQTHWVRWPDAVRVVDLTFESSASPVQLMGASLVDERNHAFYPLVLSDDFRLVHSGDVKIYETMMRPARLRLVSECEVADSTKGALVRMTDPSFDPAATVVLEADDVSLPIECALISGAERSVKGSVSLVHYDETRVTVDVQTAEPVYLLLTDAWYPGWEASVVDLAVPGADEMPLPLYRADLMFRAVPIQPGSWRVTFRYVPYILFRGLGVSLLGVLALATYTWWGARDLWVRVPAKTVSIC